ncbi:MAG: DUF1365 family protein, partial [Acidobacteriota bacterium]|nr:DUF1365 family protein [Acidobacteriota bacterium]
NYWLDGLRGQCGKKLHVSPFMKMDMDYRFVLTPPGERLVAHMETIDGGGALFDATLMLERRPWTAGVLLRALAAHPWMTAKVIGAIHWEALRLWSKRVPWYTHPDKVAQRP